MQLGQKEEESQTGRSVASTEVLGVGDPPPQVREKRTRAKVMQRRALRGAPAAPRQPAARGGEGVEGPDEAMDARVRLCLVAVGGT
ncbi:Os05g0112150 [Oryza sativa Japonica Group]|uniref:Os05g0112150 protein n=1 Tax=Oryza sativa subsp. japonica TaxID=39947 RepID=A0A0N7KK13_ORYSJ|nr:Os05g0112150 [Oryza sativa Japonica Group]